MREITVAAIQMACSWNIESNIENAENLIRQANDDGADIILLQELFETPYFCQEQLDQHRDLAHDSLENRLISHFQALARELQVVLPISFFERAEQVLFNSLAMIDCDGQLLGCYRKSHIPSGPGYQETYYFSPGDSGFIVFETQIAKIGVGICWDQWFPECARILALKGAEILLYPAAIGSEPDMPDRDSKNHWQRVMQGHAAANCIPLVTANRIGIEETDQSEIEFYGSSFICDDTGEIMEQAERDLESIVSYSFDLDQIASNRDSWGVFRDRRPDLYQQLLKL